MKENKKNPIKSILSFILTAIIVVLNFVDFSNPVWTTILWATAFLVGIILIGIETSTKGKTGNNSLDKQDIFEDKINNDLFEIKHQDNACIKEETHNCDTSYGSSKKCTNCGGSNKPDAKKCDYCGYKLK